MAKYVIFKRKNKIVGLFVRNDSSYFHKVNLNLRHN